LMTSTVTCSPPLPSVLLSAIAVERSVRSLGL
jgi:hypothetical protein